jgi:hypothetical protein
VVPIACSQPSVIAHPGSCFSAQHHKVKIVVSKGGCSEIEGAVYRMHALAACSVNGSLAVDRVSEISGIHGRDPMRLRAN